MSFVSPDNTRIATALGDVTQLPRDMKIAISKGLNESFRPVPLPRGGDWLSSHSENGQTMKSFERNTSKAVPHATFKTVYIQPIGNFNHPRSAPLDLIIQFAKAFYSVCNFELLPAMDFSSDMVHRINGNTQQIQYRTDGFYNFLTRTRSKRDTRRELLCVAVTMADIYPDENWNFVYGQARSIDGVGVYSFARLDPLFYQAPEELHKTPLSNEHRTIMLRRCVKILLHELGHLFGLHHCIYYVCLMNGANNEKEMDRQPLSLCPVCLRKLYSTFQFDVQSLYENFANICEKYGLIEETIWYRNRLDYIRSEPN